MGRVKSTRSKSTPKYVLNEAPWKKIGRSYEKITKSDLKRLLKLTKDDHKDFIRRHPKYKNLKVLSICLCQGGALHYLDGKTGIRDFDTYIFFERNQSIRYPCRRRGFGDFGESKFGKTYINPSNSQSVNKYTQAKGRYVDIMGREIDNIDNDYEKSIQNYLKEPKSATPYFLSQKAAVVLEPINDLGKIIWPLNAQTDDSN